MNSPEMTARARRCAREAGCAEADYAMKRSRGDKVELLEELLLSIMAEVSA